MIVVDDAHWADDTSLEFLHYLARRIDDLPVLLLVAHRIDQPGAATDVLTRLADLPSVVALDPSPLSDSAVGSSCVRCSG